jgi:hypothetical protein
MRQRRGAGGPFAKSDHRRSGWFPDQGSMSGGRRPYRTGIRFRAPPRRPRCLRYRAYASRVAVLCMTQCSLAVPQSRSRNLQRRPTEHAPETVTARIDHVILMGMTGRLVSSLAIGVPKGCNRSPGYWQRCRESICAPSPGLRYRWLSRIPKGSAFAPSRPADERPSVYARPGLLSATTAHGSPDSSISTRTPTTPSVGAWPPWASWCSRRRGNGWSDHRCAVHAGTHCGRAESGSAASPAPAADTSLGGAVNAAP